MKKKQGTMRDLLARIGIGQFNATGVIQYMFMAPATTDPKAAAIILLVTHLQQALVQLGYPLTVTGYLDQTTAKAFASCVGPGWESRSWGDNTSAIVNALVEQKMVSGELAKTSALGDVDRGQYVKAAPLSFWDPPILPSVPGGIVTYAIGAAVAYHFWNKRKR